MKKTATLFVAFMLMLIGVATAQSTNWSVDPAHSSIKFTVPHMSISEVEGRFGAFTGTLVAPGADFNNAQVSFSVDVASVNTDNDMRDKHLKSDDFFNAEKYPKMTFVSTSFKKIKGNTYTLEGNLTIRDVTKKVKFAVTYGGTMTDPYGNIKSGFKATGKISRAAYNLKWNTVKEGVAVVGDEVTILLNLEFAKAK
jgi:polyisoprenoid-binding protein YceI